MPRTNNWRIHAVFFESRAAGAQTGGIAMKSMSLLLCLCLAAGASWAGPQQEKMKQCNATAKEKSLAGDERKAFMSDCLKAKPADSATSTQQGKMKTCNADAKAKALAGDERKKFMAECLKAK
jgi:hypothetical protein